jgi:hypothetical protein
MVSTLKMAYVTISYMGNYRANVYNIKILQEAAEDIKAGKKVEEIVLMPSPTDLVTNIENHYERQHNSICEFYELPYSIEIRVMQ